MRQNESNCYSLPPISPRLIIPTSFQDCLTYGQRQLYMWKVIEQLQERVATLEEEIENLTQPL